MATAWNLKKVHEILNTKIKTDVNNIYSSLVQIDRAVDALMAVDQAATSKNGTTVSNFSGHKAMAFFSIMKNSGGYYSHSESFYRSSYKLCRTIIARAQERAVKDNNAKYKAYTKWSATLPTKTGYSFNHVINLGVTEEITNVSSNIYTLRDQLDAAYTTYIKDAQNFSKDLSTLKKYTPDALDKKIVSVIKNIDSRITATNQRRKQLNSYINEVVLQYLIANREDESAMSSAAADFASNGPATRNIDS